MWLINIECGFTNKYRGNKQPEEFIKTKYPAIYNHFMKVASAKTKGKGLINRDDKGDYWWELRSCAYTNDFSKQKIVFSRISGDEPCFAYDDTGIKNDPDDGFSRDKNKRSFLANNLFFDEENGIISILKKYNWTIEENSPADIEVALDPELLGKVFENLLGTYNPETRETARKDSGSFYTPRPIVQYMTDESLISYLSKKIDCNLDIYNPFFCNI